MNHTTEHQEQYRQVAVKLLKPQLKKTRASSDPWAILVGGQLGAGKSTLVASLREEWQNNGEGVVKIDPDHVRLQLHKWQSEAEEQDGNHQEEEEPEAENDIFDFGFASNWEDNGRVDNDGACNQAFFATMETVTEMITLGVEQQRNLLLEGTFQNTRETSRLIAQLIEQGYKIAFHCVATNTELSLARIYYRNECELQATKGTNEPTMHYVDERAHDEAAIGIVKTVKTIESQGLGHQLVIHGRDKRGEPQRVTWQYDEMAGGYELEEEQKTERENNQHEPGAGRVAVDWQTRLEVNTIAQIENTWTKTLAMLEQRKLAEAVTPEEYQAINQTYEIQRRRISSLMAKGDNGEQGARVEHQTNSWATKTTIPKTRYLS